MNIDLILAWLWPVFLTSILIFAVALMLVFLLQRSSAAVRHLILTAAFLGTAAYAITLLFPKWQIPVFDPIQPDFSPNTAYHLVQPGTPPAIIRSSPEGMVSIPTEPDRFVLGPRGIIVLLWLGGTIFFLARLSAGLLALSRITRASSEFKTELSFATTARLHLTPKIDLPLTWGWLRPQILLPSSFSEWTADQRRLALHHEIAHVRRRDWAVFILARVVQGVLWINPFAWFALRQLQAEQEKAADDLVLADSNATAYATALLEFARRLHSAPALPAVPILRAGSLEDRVRSLLNDRASRRRPGAGYIVATACIVLAVTASAIVQLTAREARSAAGRTLSETEMRFLGTWRGGGMFPNTFNFKEDGTYELRPPLLGDQSLPEDRPVITKSSDGTIRIWDMPKQTTLITGTWSIDGDLLTYTATSPTNFPAKTRRILQVSSNFFQWQFVGEETKNIFGYRRIGNVEFGTIAGAVLRQGKPLADTDVFLEPFTPEGKPLPRSETKTDNEGRFAFHALSPGLYKVSRSVHWNAITDQGSSQTATWTHAQVIELEKDKTAEITLAQGRTIRGEFEPPAGMTKDQIAFTAGDFRFLTPKQRRADGISIVYVMEIARDGTFLVPDLPPGQYTLYATVRKMNGPLDADHIASASAEITVTSGTTEQTIGKVQLVSAPAAN